MSASNWLTLAVAVLGFVGTVGTALGSLAINGRRAEQQRREDQARDDRLRAEERAARQVEQWRAERQAAYSECMDAAQGLSDLLQFFALPGEPDHEEATEQMRKVTEAAERLRLVTQRTRLVCGLDAIPRVLAKTQDKAFNAWLLASQRAQAPQQQDGVNLWRMQFREACTSLTLSRAEMLDVFRQDLGIANRTPYGTWGAPPG